MMEKLVYNMDRLLSLYESDIVYDEISMDFRPYMDLSVDKGITPGVWILLTLIRKITKHLVLSIISQYSNLNMKIDGCNDFIHLVQCWKERNVDERLRQMIPQCCRYENYGQ